MKRNIYNVLSKAKQGWVALALFVSGTAHSQATYTFNYTGAVQTLTLPAGFWGIECWGANGGDVSAGPGGGGKGGYSKGTLNVVSSGTQLNIYVGGKGVSVSGTSAPGGAGGWNGGGGGGSVGRSGGGGGGATDVRVGGTAATDRVIVAGGGGGAAYYNSLAAGGNGGGPAGQNGDIVNNATPPVTTVGGGGAGANGASPGIGGTGYPNTNGTATGGGGGGQSPGIGPGQPGTGGGAGGAGGGSGSGSTGCSGGGGGGYAGGAGGTQTVNVAAAGGGGSGYVGGVSSGTTVMLGQPGFVTNPDVTGNGKVIITELCNISLTASGSNSLFPSICSGQSLTLTTDAVSNYSWSTGNTSSPTVAVSPTTTTVYTLSATSVSNCTTSRSITVIVNAAAPVLSVTTAPSSSVCSGQTATLTAAGALSYTLSGGTGNITNGQTFTPTATSNYTITGQNGCGTTSVVTSITVTPLPVTASASSTLICSATPATLTAGGATSYTWTTQTSTNVSSGYIVNPASNTTYSLTGKTGPCLGTATITIFTKALPTLTVTASNSVICNGSTANLSVAGTATSYAWSPGGQVGASIAVTPTVTTLFSVTGTNTNNCLNTVSQVVIVNALPVISASAVNSVVCSGASATLSASGGDTYLWSSGGTSVVTVVNPTGNSTYSVTGTNTNNCSATATVDVNVYIPAIGVSSNTSVCAGANTGISASGADTYVWSNGGQSAGITVSPSLTTVYTVTGSVTDPVSSIACPATNTVMVTVNPNPTVMATADHTVICLGNQAVLTAVGADSYTWTGGSGAVYAATNTVSPIANQSYSVSGVDANGCKAGSMLTIQVSTCLGINSITANAGSLLIYPNPGRGEITIRCDQAITLQVTNELGQLISTISISGTEQEAKLNDLSMGVYFITGSNANGSVKHKLIITQ